MPHAGRWMLMAAGVLAAAAPAGAQTAPAERSDVAIVLEIQQLLIPDRQVDDPVLRDKMLLKDLRKVPALMAAFESKFATSRHRPVAWSLAVSAMVMRRQIGDRTVTSDGIIQAAKTLVASSTQAKYQAQGRLVILEVTADEALALALKVPATATVSSRPAATQAARARHKKMAGAYAGQFVRFADRYAKTTFAPPALYNAGGMYLEAGRENAAVAAFDRLSRDYAKDPLALKALMILVQLHARAGRPDKALAAKRRCVQNFEDSPAAMKYRADIAQAECLGKPFFLRFRSVRGRAFNVCDHRAKTVLVYFYALVSEEGLTERVTTTMANLGRLAQQTGCVLVAVGADEKTRSKKVAAILDGAKIDTPNLLDPEGKVATQYGVLFVPAVAVVAPGGKLKAIVTHADIVPAVRKALRAAASGPASRSATEPATRPIK